MKQIVQVPNVQPFIGNTIIKENSFLAMLHGKATDNIATMTGNTIIENKLNDTGILDTGEVKLVIDKFTKLSGTLGVSTHKLLSTVIAEFTNINHTGNKTRKLSYTTVNIPLKEYALKCGYNVKENKTETPQEAKKEAKRIKCIMDNVRKKVRKDLNILFSASLSWKEKIQGKQGNFLDVRLIEAKGIKNGYIQITFTQTFAEYLIKLPLTQYPVNLLRVDERNNNAYIMGLKMTEHFNLDNNQIQGTSQLLKVKTLLANTTLPDINSTSVKKVGWETRIKEPFENSLDALTACNLLEKWEYCKSKGQALTYREATNFQSYEKWSETLIKFTLKNAPNHENRLQAKK